MVLAGRLHELVPVRVVARGRRGRENARTRVGGAARVGPVDEEGPHAPEARLVARGGADQAAADHRHLVPRHVPILMSAFCG